MAPGPRFIARLDQYLKFQILRYPMTLDAHPDPRIGPLDPIALRGLRDHVHKALREAIISGRFRSGDKLNERLLAAELGVSTTPVKEALQRLATDGLVRIEPRRGVYARFNAEQAEQMMLARAALEGMIAREAARRAGDDDLARIDRHITAMNHATQDGAVEQLIVLNGKFHDAIQVASGCAYLVSLLDGQRIHDHAARVALLGDAAERKRALREHRAIAGALADRDADRAELAMREHIIRSGRQHIETVFGPPPRGELR
jgi:DNA-binding GntR family transcriptional regulator